MKKNLKFLIAVFLIAAMLLTAAPFMELSPVIFEASAEEITDNGITYYVYSDGEVEVENAEKSISGAITLPKEINGYSVTSIGWCAFKDCPSLTGITIPDSVTYIGNSAFEGCTSLMGITIPASVTHIGSRAIHNTAYYNNEANWENGILYIGNRLIEVKETFAGEISIKNGITQIPSYAFEGRSNITGITIPEGVTDIGSSAFEDCTSLTSITIPDSVTKIASYTFEGCSSLKSITIPDSVTEIAYRVFFDCSSLADIEIPDKITSIGYDAFHGTAYYNDSENWEDGVLYLDKYLYDADPDISGICTVKNGTVNIGSYAFSECKFLTGVNIPESVRTIGNCTFMFCTALTSITIPKGVTSIGIGAFRYCSALESITVPDSVENIGADMIYDTAYYNDDANWENGALYVGNHLVEVNGVKGAYEIKQGTKTVASFSYNNELTGISIPSSVTSLQYGTFRRCDELSSVKLPDTLIKIAPGVFYGTAFLENYENYENGILYSGKYLIRAKAPYSVWNDETWEWEDMPGISGNVTVKDGTKYIISEAFSGCEDITSVKLPASVEYIGCNAFDYCDGLTEITLPESVSLVETKAFWCCYGLKKITVLNPKAELADGFVKNYDGSVIEEIYGYDNSTAQLYAKEYGIRFVSLGAYDVSKYVTETETVKTVGENSIFAVADNTVDVLISNINTDVVIKDKDGKDVAASDRLKSGMTVTFTDAEGKAVKTLTVVVPGDNDGDGSVSSSDARSALRAAVGLDKLNDWQMSASDVEDLEQKKISSADARYILRAAVGLESFKAWIKNVK